MLETASGCYIDLGTSREFHNNFLQNDQHSMLISKIIVLSENKEHGFKP